MEPRTWVIGKVVSISDSKFGKKINFYLNGYDEEVSCFTKWPDNMKEGAEVYGHVERNGNYHNFKWDKKPEGVRSGGNTDGFTQEDRMMLGAIYNWVQNKRNSEYPTNDVRPEDMAF